MDRKTVKQLRIIFILSAVLFIWLATVSMTYAKPVNETLVNLTVPGNLNVKQDAGGNVLTDDFVIENGSPLDFTIRDIEADSLNEWELTDKRVFNEPNKKIIKVSIADKVLKNGENTAEIPIRAESSRNISIDVKMNMFTIPVKEKALKLKLTYNYEPGEFSIVFEQTGDEKIEPVKALNGEKVRLPVPSDKDKFRGWKDPYTGIFYKDSMIMPIGGTKLIALWEEAFLDTERFKHIDPMTGGGILSDSQKDWDKAITGLTLRCGTEIPDDVEKWDISVKQDKSVMAHRGAAESSDPEYNDVYIVSNSNNLVFTGDTDYMFASKEETTPIEFIRSEDVFWKFEERRIFHTFRGCNKLKDISGLGYLDTSNVTTMECAFFITKNLEDITPLSKWDTSNVRNMVRVFSLCKSITSCEAIKNWDVSKVQSMEHMFYYNSSMEYADLTNWKLDSLRETGNSIFAVVNNLRLARCANEHYADLLNVGIGKKCRFVAPHKITFNTDGAGEIESVTDFSNETIQLPVLKKEGYVFKHWTDQKKVIYNDTLVIPRYDVKLKAVWEPL